MKTSSSSKPVINLVIGLTIFCLTAVSVFFLIFPLLYWEDGTILALIFGIPVVVAGLITWAVTRRLFKQAWYLRLFQSNQT